MHMEPWCSGLVKKPGVYKQHTNIVFFFLYVYIMYIVHKAMCLTSSSIANIMDQK